MLMQAAIRANWRVCSILIGHSLSEVLLSLMYIYIFKKICKNIKYFIYLRKVCVDLDSINHNCVNSYTLICY